MPSRKRENRDQTAQTNPPPPAAESAQDNSTPRGGGLVVVLPTPNTPEMTSSEQKGSVVDDRMLDRRTQAAIGHQLRTFYNDIATEPIPDKLLQLLEELEQKNNGSAS